MSDPSDLVREAVKSTTGGYVNADYARRLERELEEARAEIRSLKVHRPISHIELSKAEAAAEEARQERDAATKWLRFIAETQHKLLDAIKVEVTDEEWAAFSEALNLQPTTDNEPAID